MSDDTLNRAVEALAYGSPTTHHPAPSRELELLKANAEVAMLYTEAVDRLQEAKRLLTALDGADHDDALWREVAEFVADPFPQGSRPNDALPILVREQRAYIDKMEAVFRAMNDAWTGAFHTPGEFAVQLDLGDNIYVEGPKWLIARVRMLEAREQQAREQRDAAVSLSNQAAEENVRLRDALDEIDYDLNANIDMRALGVSIPAVYRARVAAAQALGKDRVCDADMPSETEQRTFISLIQYKNTVEMYQRWATTGRFYK